MQVLNKFEKEQLVIQMHQDGKTIREIAATAHLSFGNIDTIIRKIDGRDDHNNDLDLSKKSKSTQAFHLFKNGKKPIDVAIELDLSANEIEDMLQEYWVLNQLEDLALLYYDIRTCLPSFIKLFRLLKQNNMLSKNHIIEFIKYASQDLPSLENKIQSLSSEVIDLEWKKKECRDELAMLGSSISAQRKSLDTLQMAIEYKKQILADWDNKIS
jgi:hypothetical protein